MSEEWVCLIGLIIVVISVAMLIWTLCVLGDDKP